ncbi:unnamed protein product [Bursaphelenchus okinawaensis]|uniref:BHLH domain-containing protein n=1 Tax=Bursaphelenchus okinawaensis TaxID=465554 RepID=A0A811JSQ9_9BILA|nr:unnamed protein product [Bursaphelenchus okinawaensis]CAG9081942.1 unnamed protein product [Bursaphelenchus okinawaensis]
MASFHPSGESKENKDVENTSTSSVGAVPFYPQYANYTTHVYDSSALATSSEAPATFTEVKGGNAAVVGAPKSDFKSEASHLPQSSYPSTTTISSLQPLSQTTPVPVLNSSPVMAPNLYNEEASEISSALGYSSYSAPHSFAAGSSHDVSYWQPPQEVYPGPIPSYPNVLLHGDEVTSPSYSTLPTDNRVDPANLSAAYNSPYMLCPPYLPDGTQDPLALRYIADGSFYQQPSIQSLPIDTQYVPNSTPRNLDPYVPPIAGTPSELSMLPTKDASSAFTSPVNGIPNASTMMYPNNVLMQKQRSRRSRSLKDSDDDIRSNEDKEQERRSANNNRERIRVKDINTAFKELGKMCSQHIPNTNERNLTKLSILHHAVQVINGLESQVRQRNMNPRATSMRRREQAQQ